MSVIINTNSAATVAGNNLASANALLRKSLNRLSSGSKIVNPSDDAGGLAVSMKLSAAAVRQGAVSNNIANALSMLQTQDGVLAVTGKILNRISELKVLNSDITKSASDRGNYQAEFAALQTQLTAGGAEKFNGVSLFGSTSLNVAATEDGNTSIGLQGVALLGAPAFPALSDNFADLSNWTTQVLGGAGGPSVTAAGNSLVLNSATGAIVSATSNASYSGAFVLTLNFQNSGIGGLFNIQAGGGFQFTYSADNNPHSLRMVADGAGNLSNYLDGSSTAYSSILGAPGSGNILLGHNGGVGASTSVQNYSITSTVTGNVPDVTSASSLSSLALSSVTNAIKDVATYRAQNGASQSRFGFASELLSVNKANLEAANSRILDVDVAQESTSLARFNVLVQAGTSMLAQANQSSQIALKLLQ
jgi:flagellin